MVNSGYEYNDTKTQVRFCRYSQSIVLGKESGEFVANELGHVPLHIINLCLPCFICHTYYIDYSLKPFLNLPEYCIYL